MKYSIRSFKIKYEANEAPPRDLLNNPGKVAEMAGKLFADLDFGASAEHFGVFYLNTQNELLAYKDIATGTIDQVAVYPRMLIHGALMLGASGLILVHNHPSGATSPSEDDKKLTRTISEAGRLFDVRVLDHIIIGEKGNHFSFLEKGVL